MKRILTHLLSCEPAAHILLIAESISERILAAGIAASLLIAVILLLRFLLRKYRRSCSYHLWGSLGLLCVLFTVPGSVCDAAAKLMHRLTGEIFSGDTLMQIEKWSQSASPAQLSDIPSAAVSSAQSSDIMPSASASPAEGAVPFSDVELLSALFTLIWLLGGVILTVLTIRSFLRVSKSIRFAVKTDEPDVRESDQIPGAFVRGLFRARIYLPASTDPKYRKYILLHERYHMRRKDNFALLFARILVILFWYHPLMWLAQEKMRQDMEISCDEKVISGLKREDIADYAAALLACGTERHTGFAAFTGNRRSVLSLRIRAIVSEKKTRFFLPAAAAAVCLITAFFVFLFFSITSVSMTDGVQTNIDADADTVYSENRIFPAGDNDSVPETAEKESAMTVQQDTADAPSSGHSPERENSTRQSAERFSVSFSPSDGREENTPVQNADRTDQTETAGRIPAETNAAGPAAGETAAQESSPDSFAPGSSSPSSENRNPAQNAPDSDPQNPAESVENGTGIVSYDPDTGITVWRDAEGNTVLSGLSVPYGTSSEEGLPPSTSAGSQPAA